MSNDSFDIVANIDFPDFEKAERVHDWRNYIGPRTRKKWSTLSRDLRYALILDAEEMADREEWE